MTRPQRQLNAYRNAMALRYLVMEANPGWSDDQAREYILRDLKIPRPRSAKRRRRQSR